MRSELVFCFSGVSSGFLCLMCPLTRACKFNVWGGEVYLSSVSEISLVWCITKDLCWTGLPLVKRKRWSTVIFPGLVSFTLLMPGDFAKVQVSCCSLCSGSVMRTMFRFSDAILFLTKRLSSDFRKYKNRYLHTGQNSRAEENIMWTNNINLFLQMILNISSLLTEELQRNRKQICRFFLICKSIRLTWSDRYNRFTNASQHQNKVLTIQT